VREDATTPVDDAEQEPFDARIAMENSDSGRWEIGVAGAFAGTKSAFQAIHALREAGFTRTWVGFFKGAPDDETATVLDAEWEGDPHEALGVFPMRDGEQRPLQEALRRVGVPEASAQCLDRSVPAPAIVVVVDATLLWFDKAASLLKAYGGHLPARPSTRR
jgi:hypothetical protein